MLQHHYDAEIMTLWQKKTKKKQQKKNKKTSRPQEPNLYPTGQATLRERRFNVDAKSSTLMRRCINVMCPLTRLLGKI